MRSPPLSPAQAFVISFTSDFIPRLVYLYMYSKDGTMHGFVNHTLSSFDVSDFQNGTAPNDPLDLGYEVQICRYCSRQLVLKSRICWAAGETLAGAGVLSGAVTEQLGLGVRVGGDLEVQGSFRQSWIQGPQQASLGPCPPTLLFCMRTSFPGRHKDPQQLLLCSLSARQPQWEERLSLIVSNRLRIESCCPDMRLRPVPDLSLLPAGRGLLLTRPGLCTMVWGIGASQGKLGCCDLKNGRWMLDRQKQQMSEIA